MSMLQRAVLALIISGFTNFSVAQAAPKFHQPKLMPQNSGTTQLLIAVSPVNSRVVWASGTGGTYVVTTDGGAHWKAGVVPGAESLQFRDVQGVSDKVAYLMSIGNNTTDFRIYKTVDGGANWTIEFTNELANAFYDCFAFWTPKRGLAHSDSVNGVFPELRTTDGMTWNSIASNMPPALAGEASFSSSGTCITTQGGRNAYDTPLVSSPSAGGLSVAFRDPWHGIVGGGDLADDTAIDAATSDDGGQTWTLTTKPPVQGTIFCLAYVRGISHEDGDDDEQDRAVVITTETQP